MDVVLEARGLDGRIARKTVASQVTVAAGSVYSVDITPADIPLQSVGGVAQVKVKMVYVEGGVTKTAQAGPLRMHVTYNAGYSRAWATTDNMLALGIAATQLQGGTSFVDSTEVMNKAVSFADNPYSDPMLAGKLLAIGQAETGRFRNASGTWVTLSAAQSGLQYTGGGSFMWEENFYQKLRDAAVIDGPPPEPLALPRSVKFCFKLSPDFRDNGTEAYLMGNLRSPASRTRATLRGYRQTDVLLDHALLDNQGCATVTLRDTNTCFQAELDPGLIGTGTTAFTVTEKGTSPIFATGICFKPTALGGPLNTVSWGPSFDNPSIRVMAVASRIATMPDSGFLRSSPTPRRIESESGCPYGGGLDFRARNAQGTLLGYDGEACFDGATAYFGPALAPQTNIPLQFHTTDDKFVIGHELGHMQQAASVGSTSVAYPFFDPNGGPTPARPIACACDSVVSSNRYHCLNSREYSSPAQSEGWAHFFSAKVMNNPTATSWNFGYYKEVRTDTVFVRTPPVAVDSKVPVKYRNRNCPLVEVGTEWDWLTFLTNVHTTGTNKLSMTELADVYHVHVA